jgi:vacuolar-type H+-ATPase subunit I/STV1
MAAGFELCLEMLGYKLSETDMERLIKNCIAVKISKLKKQLNGLKNRNRREEIKDAWSCHELLGDEFLLTTKDAIEKYRELVDQLSIANETQNENIEKQAEKLYEAIKAEKAMKEQVGLLSYDDVGEKQKSRHIQQFR